MRLGDKITLPSFNYPFAFSTENECVLLWAESKYDRSMWVSALKALMQSSDQEQVSNFSGVRRTGKNKFVIDLRARLVVGYGS